MHKVTIHFYGRRQRTIGRWRYYRGNDIEQSKHNKIKTDDHEFYFYNSTPAKRYQLNISRRVTHYCDVEDSIHVDLNLFHL